MKPSKSKRRYLVAIPAALVIAIGCAMLGVLAYAAQNKEDRLVKGLKVGGVAVGGQSARSAKAKVEKVWLQPYNKPLKVHYKEKEFSLPVEQIHLTLSSAQAVKQATQKGRQGSFLTRGWRSLTGAKIKEDIPLKVQFSHGAVDQFVADIEKAINRPVVNASLSFQPTGIERKPSQQGLAIDRKELRTKIIKALSDPKEDRDIVATAKIVRPKTTSSQLPSRYPAVLMVDRSKFRLTLYKHLKPKKRYKITVGQKGLETPAGQYTIYNKQKNPAWHVPNSDWAGDKAGKVISGDDPKNPLKSRWMGIAEGAGIHGTANESKLGTADSHGCVRMAVKDVEELYDQVPVGSPVYIH